MAKKIQIGPAERLGLELPARHREILLDINSLDPDLVRRIQDAPSNQPMVEFTLEELNRLACYVDAETSHTTSAATKDKLKTVASRICSLEELFERR